jgi:predicted nucleic acid-binding protein
MPGYLLDTNVLSELMKRVPSPAVTRRLNEVAGNPLYSSSICFMELRFGSQRHPEGARIWKRIREEIEPLVSVLSFGYEEATLAGEILAVLEARGTPIGLEDVLIGSTALSHGLSIATRNVKHFSRIEGLSVENWWV